MADGSLIFDTKLDTQGIKNGISGLASIGAKATAVISGLAMAGTVAIGKMAVSAYADSEQLVGGVDTLFKKSSQKVQEYAKIAFKSAGMSANDYMQTVTGFSASLLQSLGGDTEKAADYADMAIRDMSDNANKMGTEMGLIVNTYQGFAKQNYTMLDNLKLGYGGTKTEMERLLADAEKISGIKYDISSYADVVSAIHVMQEKMGIAGTTAKEAEKTITGSFLAMKASAQNLLAGFGNKDADIGKLTQDLISSFNTVVSNVTPVVSQIAKSIPDTLSALISATSQILPQLLNSVVPVFQSLITALIGLLPKISQTVFSLLNTITSTLVDNAPFLMNVIGTLIAGVLEFLPQLIEAGTQIITALANSLTANPGEMIAKVISLLTGIFDSIIANIPIIAKAGFSILLAIGKGLAENIPILVAEIPRIINELANAIYGLLPELIITGVQIIWALITGLIQAIPDIIANLPQIIMAIINVFTLVNWAGVGKGIIAKIGQGIKGAGSSLKAIAVNTIKNFSSGMAEFIPYLLRTAKQGMGGFVKVIADFGWHLKATALQTARNVVQGFLQILPRLPQLGKDMISGIINGIKANAGFLIDSMVNLAKNALDRVKEFLGIKSPSRVMRDQVGKPITQGMAVGVLAEQDKLNNAIISVSDEALASAMEKAGNYEEIGKIYSDKMSSGIKKHADNAVSSIKSLVDKSVAELTKSNKKAKSEYAKAGKEVATAYAKAIKENIAKVQEEISAEVERITQEAQQQYDDIMSKQSEMERKLADFGNLFIIDQETGEAVVENLNSQIDAIKRYDEVLSNLKSKGASDEFMGEIAKLGVDEGTKYATALLKMSDDQFAQYQNAWAEKQKLAKEVAMKFYKDQLDALQSDFVNKLDSTLKSVPATVKNIGVNAIEGMIEGMNSRKQNAVNKAREIADAVISEMQSAMDIHSPSRIMRDLIGKNIVKGIEVGITDEQRSLIARMRAMVQQSQAEMSAVLNSKWNAGLGARVVTNNNNNGVNQVVNINQPVRSAVETRREMVRSIKELAYV